MPHTLYAIHGSHPCDTVARALRLKGQPYRVVELIPGVHVAHQWLRFRAATVPVLVLGSGEQIVGSRAIVHRLDQLVPDPPLLPADAAARARVVEAERWGDEVLQDVPRRLVWVGIARRPDALVSYAQGSKLPLPPAVQRLSAPLIARTSMARNKASEARARVDVAALPAQLDTVDAWIADGVLGGPQPNAADLQIAPSLRLLGSLADLRPLLEGRPCWALTQRLFPGFVGELPPGALPA